MSILKSIQEAQVQSRTEKEKLGRPMDDIEGTWTYDSYGYENECCEEYNEQDYSDGEIPDPPPSVSGAGAGGVSSEKPEDRFSGLAKRFKSVENCGNATDESLATNLTDLFRKGMDEGQYEQLVKDEATLRPSNCAGLQTVKMNRPIWDIISRNTQTVDSKLQTRGPRWSYIAHLSIFVTYMVYQGQAINSFQIRHTLGFVRKICLQIFFFVFGQWS